MLCCSKKHIGCFLVIFTFKKTKKSFSIVINFGESKDIQLKRIVYVDNEKIHSKTVSCGVIFPENVIKFESSIFPDQIKQDSIVEIRTEINYIGLNERPFSTKFTLGVNQDFIRLYKEFCFLNKKSPKSKKVKELFDEMSNIKGTVYMLPNSVIK